jgi:murein DD-endopeptidase MepM/ murein hydrolase activator NlpD
LIAQRSHSTRRLSVTAYVAILSCSLSLAAGIAAASDADGGGGVSVQPSERAHGVFPVRGHHTYGDGLGAGRGHQGQDILAKCGTRVVAAAGGRVYYRKFQSAAGNYVVINLHDGRSMVYEHLLHPALVHRGQRVRTAQKLGLVGSTGDATACHLHFELWSKPGWYKGGRVLNPTPLLKALDRRS